MHTTAALQDEVGSLWTPQNMVGRPTKHWKPTPIAHQIAEFPRKASYPTTLKANAFVLQFPGSAISANCLSTPTTKLVIIRHSSTETASLLPMKRITQLFLHTCMQYATRIQWIITYSATSASCLSNSTENNYVDIYMCFTKQYNISCHKAKRLVVLRGWECNRRPGRI